MLFLRILEQILEDYLKPGQDKKKEITCPGPYALTKEI